MFTIALETREHSCRVHGVGSFISPSSFFNILKEKRTRITNAELMARDRPREEEIEKTKKEIVELKALITASNLHSPNLSHKESC